MNAVNRLVLIFLVAVVLAGCWESRLNVRPEKRLGNSESGSLHFNAAEYRAILSVPRHDKGGGQFITCMEPSPDIAKVFGSAFGASVEGKEPKSGVQASLAVSMSRASSAAQLGERLATIQLLRDVLYRACEAYANGALNQTSYSVIMSRMDDMIVTMLLGELAAGNFGRPLASLSSGAGGASLTGNDGQQDLAEALQEQADADDKLLTDTKSLEEALTDLNQTCAAAEEEVIEQAEARTACTPDGTATDNTDESDDALPDTEDASQNDGSTPDEQDIKDAIGKVEQAQEDKSESEARFYIARAQTQAIARAVTGGIDANISDKQVELLTELARKYLENVNFDALVVACLHALQESNQKTGGEVDEIDVTIGNKAFVERGGLVALDEVSLNGMCYHMMTEGPFSKLMESEIRMIEAKKRQVDLEQLIVDFDHYARAVHQLQVLMGAVRQSAAPSPKASSD